jgi:hypothetical protein
MASETEAGPDSITVPAGTYRLTLNALPTVNQDLTVTGAGPSVTVITGSRAAGGTATNRAGAILQMAGTLTLSKLQIYGNSVAVDNPATQSVQISAGGIVNRSAGGLTLIDTVVRGNTVRLPGQIAAGGIETGSLTLTNSEVAGNVASVRGATQFAGGVIASAIEMNGSNVSGNTAGGDATSADGGMFAGSGAITNSTISANTLAADSVTSGVGGLDAATATITNTTISGNTASAVSATGLTGGLQTGTLEVRNGTIANNSARDVGNVRGQGTATLRNTIVAAGGGPNCSGTVTSGGGNVEDANTCGFSTAGGDKPGTDPLLGPLQLNGGPTATHALLAGSPAIDAVPAANPCPGTDQRLVGRPVGPACDSGAFEFVPPPPANTGLPAVTGTPTVGNTLQCQPGTWTGGPTFSFAWLRNGTPIAGAGGAAYGLTAADVGRAIQCRVTGSNLGGQTVATSAPAVAATIANRSRPAIKGKVRVGKRVRCAPGTWTGKPAFAFAWLRDGKRIAGVKKQRYKLRKRDRGRALQCRVTARKAGVAVVAESRPKIVKR